MPRRGLFSYENALVLILGITFGIVFFDRQAASNMMPWIQPALGLNNTQIGAVSSALAITWAISAYVVGLISDKTGQRKMTLIICVIGFSLCSFVSGLAHNFEVFVASRFFMGILEGGVMPICLTIMMLQSAEKRRALNAGIVQNGFSNLIGNMAGPIILVWAATNIGWRESFYLSAVPGLLCALAIWLWVKEPPKDSFHNADGTAPKSMNVIEMLKVRNVLVCCLVSVFMVGWLITGFAFLPVVLTQFRGLEPAVMGNIMAALGFGAFLFGALLPAVSDHIGRKPVLLFGTITAIVTPLAALYFQGPVLVLGALMFIGWVGIGIFPMFMGAIPGESLPRAQMATAMGLVVGIGELIGGVGAPLIAGKIADSSPLGLQAPMFVMCAGAIIATVIALFLKETAPAIVAKAEANRLAAASSTSTAA